MTETFLALWWLPAWHRPAVAEGVARLERLRADGSVPHAFALRRLFTSPESEGERADPIDLPGERPAR